MSRAACRMNRGSVGGGLHAGRCRPAGTSPIMWLGADSAPSVATGHAEAGRSSKAGASASGRPQAPAQSACAPSAGATGAPPQPWAGWLSSSAPQLRHGHAALATTRLATRASDEGLSATDRIIRRAGPPVKDASRAETLNRPGGPAPGPSREFRRGCSCGPEPALFLNGPAALARAGRRLARGRKASPWRPHAPIGMRHVLPFHDRLHLARNLGMVPGDIVFLG